MKTVSLDQILDILKRGIELSNNEYVMSNEDMEKARKIAELLGLEIPSWSSIPREVAEALEGLIESNGEKVLSDTIEDPARWETSWDFDAYKVGDRYVIIEKYSTPDSWVVTIKPLASYEEVKKHYREWLNTVKEQLEEEEPFIENEEVYGELESTIGDIEESLKEEPE